MTRPMSEEREEAIEAAKRVVVAFESAAIDGVELVGHEVEYLAVCKALLSTSSTERGMREALEALARPDGFARLTRSEEKAARIAFALAALSSKGEG